jgi:hypothetical protein
VQEAVGVAGGQHAGFGGVDDIIGDGGQHGGLFRGGPQSGERFDEHGVDSSEEAV